MRLRLRIHVLFYMCIETEFVIDLRNGLHMRPVLKCAFHYDRVGSCVHLSAYELNTATTTTKQKQQKNERKMKNNNKTKPKPKNETDTLLKHWL